MNKLTPACRSDNMAANVVATAEQHKAHAKVWNPGDMEMQTGFSDPNMPDVMFSPNAGIGACYSSREAAQAALAARGEGK